MIDSRTIAQALTRLIREGNDESKVLAWLEGYIQEHHLEDSLPSIVRHLEALAFEEARLEQMHIRSPYMLDAEEVARITTYVGAPQNAQAQVTEDKSLIGGIVAEYGGVVYDASIKNQIKRLEELVFRKTQTAYVS